MRVSAPCDTPLPLLYRATVSGLTPANAASSICLSRSTLQNLRNPALRFLSVFICDLPSMAITEGGADRVLEVVRQRDMGQQLAGAAGVRGGSKGVFLFGKILRNDESIFTDGAETVGQFFSGVAVHGTSLLSRVTSCHWREQELRLHFSTPRRLMLWERQPEETGSKITELVLGWVEDWVVRSDSRGFAVGG